MSSNRVINIITCLGTSMFTEARSIITGERVLLGKATNIVIQVSLKVKGSVYNTFSLLVLVYGAACCVWPNTSFVNSEVLFTEINRRIRLKTTWLDSSCCNRYQGRCYRREMNEDQTLFFVLFFLFSVQSDLYRSTALQNLFTPLPGKVYVCLSVCRLAMVARWSNRIG